MKARFYWVALLATAAMIAQVKAGGHHGGGGGGGGNFAGAAPARSGAGPSFQSMPARSFAGGRPTYAGQRFSPVGGRQFMPGNINHSERPGRFTNSGNHVITNPRREATAVGQVRNANGLPLNWRNHVVTQHSANWQRGWDRQRDYTWHGHHCRFINSSWVVFDFGFYPWGSYWYPSNFYYGYDYYPGTYYPSYYNRGYYNPGSDPGYYDQNGYGDQSTNSAVVAAQEQLARHGYYRGEIDGIFGNEVRSALVRYQTDRRLRVTGYLTTDTLGALGLGQVASY